MYLVKMGIPEYNLYPGQFAIRLKFGDGKNLDTSDILLELEEHKPLVTAVVVSGYLDESITPLLKLLKSQGFLVMLETYGTDPYLIGKLVMLGLLDSVRLRVAGCLTNRSIQRRFLWREFLRGGKYLSLFLQSLQNARVNEVEIVFDVIPGLNDRPKYVKDASILARRFGARFVLESIDPDLDLNLRPKEYKIANRQKLLELTRYSVAETWIRTRESGYEFVKP